MASKPHRDFIFKALSRTLFLLFFVFIPPVYFSEGHGKVEWHCVREMALTHKTLTAEIISAQERQMRVS